MQRALIVLTGMGILVAAALAHGMRTDRWGPSTDLQAAAAKLQEIPASFDDWTSVDRTLSERELGIAQVAGYLVREYRHKYTNEMVTMMILCGRPGPVAVHTPEVCYAGAGFIAGPSKKESVKDLGELWTADFVKHGAVNETLRIRWGWSIDGAFQASSSPRTEYARAKTLYKIYMIRPISPTQNKDSMKSPAPELELLNSLRPYLQKYLSSES